MKLPHSLRRLLRRRQTEADMAEEMRFHLEQRIADYVSEGMSPEEALHAARRRFGNLGSLQEQARDAYGWGWLDDLVRDLRLAFRQLGRAPLFALLAIITLALGVGANTAMFSILNYALLRGLPYPESHQLDAIYRSTRQNPEGSLSAADFIDLQREQAGYGEVAAYSYADTSLSEDGQPAVMPRSIRVTSNLFSVLQSKPELGRDFRPEESEPGNDRVLIISHHYWTLHFASRPDILGLKVRLNGVPCQIIGVMSESIEDWRHLGWVDAFLPLGLSKERLTNRHDLVFRVLGRRHDGISRRKGDLFIEAMGKHLASDHPVDNAGSSWSTVSLDRAALGSGSVPMLSMLIGLSAFVLLIACSNLANLLLTRTMGKAREIAVRAALGASRLQLLRPLIIESLVLSLAGGICAVVVSHWTLDWFNSRATAGYGGAQIRVVMDWHAFGWALFASLMSALAFGLAPSLFALRLNISETLKSAGRGMTGGPGHRRFRQALIIGQFALAMVLLAGGAYFGQGLSDLNRRRTGWDSEKLDTATIILPAARYSSPDKILDFQRLASEQLQALPGIASVSFASNTPFLLWYNQRRCAVEGRSPSERGREPAAVVNTVDPRYFATVGTRIISGRAFDDRDTLLSQPVCIIAQSMARALFGAESPLGQRLCDPSANKTEWREIVGIAADVEPVLPDPGSMSLQMYLPMAQNPITRGELLIRCTGKADAAPFEAIRARMMLLDSELPVRSLQPADLTINKTNYMMNVLRDLLAAFAVLGLGLASLGIYGTIARTMAERSGEFAIRIALGATVRDITRSVLGSGLRLTFVGAAIGLLGAFGVTRTLSIGFPAMRLDTPTVLLSSMSLLVLVALLASWLPARRAGRVDPVTALRSE